jgi:hypothetical protein
VPPRSNGLRDFSAAAALARRKEMLLSCLGGSGKADSSGSSSGSNGDSSGSSSNNNSRSVYDDAGEQLHFDAEWLAIVRKTHTHLHDTRSTVSVPAEIEPPSPQQVEETRALLEEAFGAGLVVPPIGPVATPGDMLFDPNRAANQKGGAKCKERESVCVIVVLLA